MAALLGLEVWLMGTPSEVDTAVRALATAGRLAEASPPEPLYGADAGRVRRYLRVNVPMSVPVTPADRAAPAGRPGTRANVGAGQAVIDLASRRTA